MKLLVKTGLFVLTLFLANAAIAQHRTFALNPDASRIGFGLNGTGHHVEGTFHVQSGSIDFDAASHSISGSIVVSAASGNSGEPSRDKKMNSEVLNTDQFAEIVFVPKSFQGTLAPSGDSNIQVTGIFTLHGTPHDLTLLMHIHIDGANLTATGQFVVPYVKWGLKDPSILILKVAKEVNIDLNLSGRVTP